MLHASDPADQDPGQLTTAAAVPSNRSGDGPLTIGRLVGTLQEEFPQLTISKVRYLEDRGLLTPRRTQGGYRTYGPADVRRLRAILTLQRDDFLPLDVIQQRLERGIASPAGRRLRSGPAGEAAETLHRLERTFTWDEAADMTGIDVPLLRQLGDYRLVEGGRGGEGRLTETDLEIARMCGLLARFGVEPRNLRLLQSSVEREAALLEQVVAPDLRSAHEDRRAKGEQTLQDLATLLAQLLDHLLYKEVRRLVE
jgi:DNA-binding transcriptional MerR regulator